MKPVRTMVTYHYTCVEHLPKILKDGYLRTTESNVSLKKEHAGPDVVWLSGRSDLHVTRGSGLEMSMFDKYAIRLTLDLPVKEVWPWKDWAKMRGSAQQTMQRLIDTAGGGHHSWFVIERPVILISECKDIINTSTGEKIQWLKS